MGAGITANVVNLHILGDAFGQVRKHPHEESKPLARVVAPHDEEVAGGGGQCCGSGREGGRRGETVHVDGVGDLEKGLIGEVLPANFRHGACAADEGTRTLLAFHQTA